MVKNNEKHDPITFFLICRRFSSCIFYVKSSSRLTLNVEFDSKLKEEVVAHIKFSVLAFVRSDSGYVRQIIKVAPGLLSTKQKF